MNKKKLRKCRDCEYFKKKVPLSLGLCSITKPLKIVDSFDRCIREGEFIQYYGIVTNKK